MGADIIKKELPVTLVSQTILQAEKIYEEHLIRDFPDNEVKPFEVIEAAMRGGRYQVFAAMLDGELAGYAFLAAGSPAESANLPAGQPVGSADLPADQPAGSANLPAGSPAESANLSAGSPAGNAGTPDGKKVGLLDYFAVVCSKRDQGIGSRIMEALSPEKTGLDCILVESERIMEDLEEEQKKERLRRIRFYERAGAKRSGVYTYLYGVFYDIMIFSAGSATISPQEAFALTDFMYHEMYPAYWFPKLADIYIDQGV